MEVASMMPVRLPDGYQPNMQYNSYHHDMRSHATAGQMMQTHQPEYGHYQSSQIVASNSPVHAPTPPEDPNKPSLPSISNLLGIADGEKSTNSQTASEARSPQHQKLHPALQQPTPVDQVSLSTFHPVLDSMGRPTGLPPTPPMRSNSMPDAIQSPSTISSHSSFSGPSYALGSMNNVDASQQRTHMPNITIPKPPPGHHTIYAPSPYMVSPYMASPTSVSGSYYSPEAIYQSSLIQQRPLPSNFPPTMIAAPMFPPGMMATSSPWEHHHFLNAANQAFSSVHDRYVCPTCKKAFSRPSSLRIHTHSHTGEKPFKCPHPGCGKAFSVRSNMKRHERGCHTPEMGAFSS